MKVLSIDFDYIMFPCIKLYNNYCAGDENPTVTWNNLESQLDIDKFLCYDAEALIDIASAILRNVKQGAKFIVIEEHHQLVDALPLNEKIDLVNIDFHHDILYTSECLPDMIDADKYNCSNWVGYLALNDKLEKYTWIKAANSQEYNNPDLPMEVHIGGKRHIKFLEDDFDYVIFCQSPQWVPYKYQHLFDLIVSLAKIQGGQ